MDNKEIGHRLEDNSVVISIIGLGYVGLNLLLEFASAGLTVIGFDVNEEKIKKLQRYVDETGEVSAGKLKKIMAENKVSFTFNSRDINGSDFFIIAVPTPITKSKKPDLRFVKNASKLVAKNIKKGSIIVLESTVYPGATEEVVRPILEKESDLKCGIDFKIGYSPERINPGDQEHRLGNVVKVVSGMDEETLELLASLYSRVTTAGVFKAKNIKTAEAAKVIENIQRDLNIALMNELSIIFEKMDIRTNDVLEAAYTKWNFSKYRPGLVGGHCIPVDPYYLVYKAKEVGYRPQVILAGRTINDYMPKHIVEHAVKGLIEAGKVLEKSNVLILGLTFKENVRDTRTSQAIQIIIELQKVGIRVVGYDSLVSAEEIKKKFGIEGLKSLKVEGFDCVIVTVSHDAFTKIKIGSLGREMNKNPVLIDVTGIFNSEEAIENGFIYYTL